MALPDWGRPDPLEDEPLPDWGRPDPLEDEPLPDALLGFGAEFDAT